MIITNANLVDDYPDFPDPDHGIAADVFDIVASMDVVDFMFNERSDIHATSEGNSTFMNANYSYKNDPQVSL